MMTGLAPCGHVYCYGSEVCVRPVAVPTNLVTGGLTVAPTPAMTAPYQALRDAVERSRRKDPRFHFIHTSTDEIESLLAERDALAAVAEAARGYVALHDIMNYPSDAAMYPRTVADALAAYDRALSKP